jgi:hypothetical protein
MPFKSGREMAVQIGRVSKAMDDRSWHPIVGAQAKEDAKTAVARDIGDHSMSGWPRAKPLDLAAEWKSLDDGIIVRPTGRTRGPWRVMEDGRKAYRAGQFRSRGSRVGKGGAYTRLALVSGTVGATQGKSTWSDATDIIAKDAAKKITKAKVAAVRKAW